MKRTIYYSFLAFFLFTFGLTIAGQTPDAAIKPSVVNGEVVAVGAASIELKTDAGQITVQLTEKTEYKRVPPTNPSLKAAVPAFLSDIGEGDKLLVTGIFSNDRKSIPARAVYLMTKSEIAQRQAKESERWATRGISGRVAAINQDTKQITVEVRGLMGSSNIVVTPKDGAIFKRYAPNSIKYSETVPSSVSNIQAGDMVRALGDRSLDGLSFAAEEVVTGAFQTVAGNVKVVNAAANEITITDLQTNKDVTIQLGSSSTLKRFPEEMAQRLAQFGGGQGGPGGMRPAGGQQPVGGQPGGAGQSGQPGRGGLGGPRGGIDEMLDRFPNITASDLKVGEMIAVSSSKNGDGSRITAIKLLAGVEPFIRAAQASGQLQRGGRGGQGGAFTIPGLDGFDSP